MARYIDADALIEQMEADAEHIDDYIAKMMLYASIDDVKNAPTADVVERKRGEWIKIDKYDKESNVQCSVCLEEFDYIDGVCYLCHGYELPLFCPNCGAEMLKEVEE